MKLWNDNLIKNLPDCYDKDNNSNHAKLLKLIQYDADKFDAIQKEIDDSLDLDNATGHTLNLYGEMVGQKRGKTTDDQYRILIKTKMTRNMCDGSYKKIVECLCRILDCAPSEILIDEVEGKCAVKVTTIPLSSIINAEFSPSQFTQLIKTLLPAGVGLESGTYAGTFEFGSSNGEASNNSGFCQSEGDNYGGYFGVLSDSNTDFVLPI